MRFHLPRRTFCKLTTIAALSAWLDSQRGVAEPLHASGGAAIGTDGQKISGTQVRVDLHWKGNVCVPSVTNLTAKPVPIREVILFEYRHNLPSETWVYGEAFQMLTQTVGTLEKTREIGYGEQTHYRIPGPTDAAVVTSLLTLSPPREGHLLLAYTSCKRFIGRFYLRPNSISASVDTEGLALAPAETWKLEELIYLTGHDRPALLDQLANALNTNHPHRTFKPVPTGWCSWYCFGRTTTAKDVIANLDRIATTLPGLKYIQIDDGYQPAMGDWLEQGPSFGGHVQDVFREIRKRGFEPAIWVAPFIAGTNSRVLREHPNWFVQSAEGKPMAAAEVTFTGWGGGGWYCLDGSNPEVQQHLENVFRTMREQWGCTYFKLDANFWGAVHGGRRHDAKATRIEAYRRGMEAVRRGAGDAFLLGCNHPMWPSLGLMDGSRSSGDISRKWKTVSNCMEQSMQRNWQNGRLWWNDPDAVVLTDRPSPPMQGTLTEEECRFHATSAYASGGMLLSGDDLTSISVPRLEMLRKLLPPTGIAAVFDDASNLEVGRILSGQVLHIAVFNRADAARTIRIPLDRSYSISEVWTGEEAGSLSGEYRIQLPAHSGRLLRCVPGT